MTEVYRVNYQGYLTTRWRMSVLMNETNLAAVLVRCQTKGTIYASGNTKMVDSGIVSVQGRAALRVHWNLNTPPHFTCSLRPVVKCFTLGDGSALVSTLATMSSVGQ